MANNISAYQWNFMKRFLLALFVYATLAIPISAQNTPLFFTFQGTFSTVSEGLINGNRSVTVKIQEGRGGRTLETKNYPSVLFVNGTCSIAIGPITVSKLDIASPYLEITIDGLTAHFPIPASAYAIQAKLADTVKAVDASVISGSFTSTVNINANMFVHTDTLSVVTSNVGIGTSTPAYKLDVNGQVNATGFKIKGQDIESVLSWQKNGTNLFYNLGNVGIATQNPVTALDVAGTINAREYRINGVELSEVLSNELAWRPGIGQGDIFFNNGKPNNQGLIVGNVGIGTSQPLSRLDVRGAIRIGEAVFTPGFGSIQYKNDDFEGFTPDGWVSLTGLQGVGNTNQITFWQDANTLGGSDSLVWDYTNQKLGIGTSNPTAQLSIKSTSANAPIMHVTDTTNKTKFYISSRNVGIGTSTPNFDLSVRGIVDAENYFLRGVPISESLTSSSFWIFQNDGRLFYDMGNVGIGTSQPRNLLELSSTPSSNPIITFDIGDVDLFSLGIDNRTPSSFILSKGGDLTKPIFVFKENKIGVGIINPSANLQVSGNSGVLFTGQFGSNEQIQASGGGTRLMWIPSKAAFRAGHVLHTQWDNANIGDYSVAIGYNPSANATGSTVIGGYENWARGEYSTVIGGFQNQAIGDHSFAGGHKAIAAHRGTFVWADYTPTASVPSFQSKERDQFLVMATNGVGINTNLTQGTGLTVKKAERDDFIFRAVGNSSAQAAFAITTSGNVGIGTTTPGTAKLAVISGSVGIGTTTPIAPLTVSPNATDEFVFVTYREDGNPSLYVRRDGRVAIGHPFSFVFPDDVTVAVAGSFGGPTFKKVDPQNPSASVVIGSNPGSPWSVPSQNNNNTFFNRGSVGIGTSTPSSLLELSNQGGIDPVLTFDIDNVDLYSLGVTRNKFTIQSSGNLTSQNPPFILDANGVGLGIGYKTPSASLHVGGQAILSGNVAIATTNISSVFNLNVNGRIRTEQLFINGLEFNPVPSPWRTNALSQIYYTSGNVGIGTSTPRAKLEVLGTVSANQIIHSQAFTLRGVLSTNQLRLVDSTGNGSTHGAVSVESEDLVYTDPNGVKKVLSSPLRRDTATTNNGYLSHWSNESTIGVTNIYWDKTKRSLDVSGNLNINTKFSENNGIKVDSSLKMGTPIGLNLVTTLNHGGDLRNVQSYTGEALALNINRNWGNLDNVVTVKGINLEITQEDQSLVLNKARVIGLHVDVASVNVNTNQGASKAAAVFLGGFVGIGTQTPQAELEVRGTVSANYFNLTGGLFVPELYVNTNALVAFKDPLTLTPRVGIGTSQPSTALEVIGTVSTNTLAISGGITASTMNINNGTLFVSSAGLIGIGTTQPNGQIEIQKTLTSSSQDAFIGKKMSLLIDGAGADQTFSFNQNLSGIRIDLTSNTGSQIGASKQIIGADIDTTSFVVASGNRLVGLNVDVSGSTGKRYAAIFTGGRVGIGVTQPLAELHVSGSILADNLFLNGTLESEKATFNRITVNTFAQFNGTVTVNELNVLGTLTANTFVLETALEAQNATFSTINAKSASINTLTKSKNLTVTNLFTGNTARFSGGVGVGTTAPANGLEVATTLKASTITASDTISLSSGTLNIQNGALFIGHNKRVGIGTTQPQNVLHVNSLLNAEFDVQDTQTWNALRIQNASNTLGSVASLLFVVDTNTASTNIGSSIGAMRSSSIASEHGSSLFFVTDPASDTPKIRMFITSEGNVGVGTTTPTSLLHVNGDAFIDGIATLNTLSTPLIRSSGELVFRPSSTLIVDGSVSSNKLIQANNGLGFKASSTIPTPRAGYGTLYVNSANNDLYYLKSTGVSVNITKGFTGKSFAIPFFNAQGQLDDKTELYWNDTSKQFKIGTANIMTLIEHRVTLNNSVAVSVASEKIVMDFGNRTTASDSIFRGLQINLTGQTPDDPDNFGRLAQNETAIGLDVDVTSLRAGRSTAQSVGADLFGFKYAAILRGGSVGIGVSQPVAGLHVAGETAGSPSLRIDTTRKDATVLTHALVVSANSFVGIGLSLPTAKLHVKAINDPLITDADEAIFHVVNTNNRTSLIVKNDGKVGIGTSTPTDLLTVSGNIFATTASFNHLVATTLNISNGGLFVNALGEVGFGTTNPQGNLTFSKTITPTNIPTDSFISQRMTLALDGGNDSLTFNLNRNITGIDIAIQSAVSSQIGANKTAKGLNIDLSQATLAAGSKAIGLFVDVTGQTGTRYAAILNGGNVGIGVTNPTVALDVSGDIKAVNLSLTGTLQAGHITANSINVLSDSQFGGSITANNLVATTISANNITLSGLFRISTASITTLNASIATFNQLGIRVHTPRQSLDVSGNAIFTGGFVGIGLTNPTSLLHLSSTSSAPPFRVQIDNGTSIPYAMVVSANGRIGISTANPSAKLSISASAGETDDLLHIQKTDATFDYMKVTNAGLVGIGVIPTRSQLHIVSSGALLSPIRIDGASKTHLFHVTASGNVGIGLTNPTSTLHVSANAGSALTVGNASNQNAFVIKNDGSVGIGTTTTTYKLNVIGSMIMGATTATLPDWINSSANIGLIAAKQSDYSIMGLELKSGSTTDYNSVIAWGSATDDNLQFRNSANDPVMTLQGNGNIGVNTANPTARLHVVGSTPFIAGTTDKPFALIVSSNGFVGINTNQPQVALDVSGSIRARGFNVTHEDLTSATINISKHLNIERTVTTNTSDIPITMQKVRLNLVGDIDKELVGINIVLDSLPNTLLGGQRDFSLFNSKAYGLKVDMTGLETEDPALGGGTDGKRYAAAFVGGAVGIGLTNPETTLQVVGEAGSNIARFGSVAADMTIKDENNGVMLLSMRNLSAGNPISNQTLFLASDKVGIGVNPRTEDPTVKLVVNGDIRVGMKTSESTSSGNRVYFSGGPVLALSTDNDNNSPLWIGRNNVAANISELLVNVGDGDGKDRFVVGFEKNNVYNPIFQVIPSANADGSLFNSRVGISDGSATTFSPQTQLHVFGATNGSASSIASHLVTFENNGGTESDTLVIWHTNYNNASEVPTGSNFITFADQTHILGEIEGSGENGVRFKTNGADYAEYLPKIIPTERFEKGDIVGVFNGKVSLNTKDAHHILVKSSAPSVAGNWPGKEKEKDYELIAFFGQVKVKVTGPVTEGDYIISSGKNDGTGIAIPQDLITPKDYGLIVGQAWESNSAKATKLVLTGVGFNFTLPKISAHLERVETLEKKLKDLQEKQSKIEKSFQAEFDRQSKEIEKLLKKLN